MQPTTPVTGFFPVHLLNDLDIFWPSVTTTLGNGYFFVISTTILTLFIIGICMIVKYAPHFLNDLRTISNNELPNLGLILWIALILLIPIFFNAGPMIFVLWWFLVLWGYLLRSEKRIVYVFISLIFLSSWIALLGAGLLTYSQTQVNKEIFTVEHDIESTKDILELSSWIQKNPADAEPMNTMSLMEIRRGNYGEAVRLLGRSLDIEPGNHRYYNHIGIALTGMGNTKEAMKAFQNAAALDPGNMLYHYNLSRLYQATYNLYESEQEIEKASSLDAKGVRILLENENKNGVKRYITEHVPLFRQLARQMHPSRELKSIADALWFTAFGIIPRNMTLYLVLGVILALFIIGHIPEEKYTKLCHRCGNYFYSGTVSKSGFPMCLQCHWIDTKAKKQMSSIMHAKTEEIKQYRLDLFSNTSKLELILPGLGSFTGNRTSRGVARIIALSAALVMVVTGGQFMFSIVPTGIDLSNEVRIFGAILLGFLYWRAYKSPPVRYGV
ncbi:MAG: tetratricopeptide repeat protein [Desulfomonilia bacterium]